MASTPAAARTLTQRSKLLRGGPDFRREVGRLPLRDTNDDRQLAHGESTSADHFGGEFGTLFDRAAETVGASIGALPEEFVDQIAVRAVQLDAIET